MTTLNPYAPELANHDTVHVLAATPDRLQAAYSALSPEQLETPPAPGKWTPREVLAHLADCEIAFGFRLRQAAAGVLVIQPFEQDDWARQYRAYTVPAAMETFRALRAWNLAFIRSLTEDQKVLPVTHPERGTMTVWTIVETMAGHDLHHLERLEPHTPHT